MMKMMRKMIEKSYKLKVDCKLLFVLLCTIRTVIAYQDASVVLETLQQNEANKSSLLSSDKQQNGTNTSSPIPTDKPDEVHNGSYDLVLHGEPGSSSSSTSSLPSQSQDQLARHTYNVTDSDKTPLTSSNKTQQDGDDLSVSDSRLIAKSVSAKRSDEDIGSDYMAEDDAGQQQQQQQQQQSLQDFYTAAMDNYGDAASSDQIEQKVMKELTKLLSKGMAGASDKVKLEKLESWKRRQKERKAMKENRAKLFEDLLTAAINTHPEEAKKKSKKRTGGTKEAEGSRGKAPGIPVLGDALQNVDPELVQDAESVLQHLQGISAVFETPSQVEPLDEANSGGSGDSDEDNQSGEEKEKSSNKKMSLERPLARSFKKIKQQFKHRRNQLDQIKKIFNVELAINPKDGSLVGKSANKKKDYKEVGDFNIYDDSTSSYSPPATARSSSKKKKGNKMSKMNELSAYLMDNPEILASVMAELTVDSDPSRPPLEPAASYQANENNQADYSSADHQPQKTSRKSSGGNHYRGMDNFDSYPSTQQPSNPLTDLDPHEFALRLGANRFRRHNSNHSLLSSSSSFSGDVYNPNQHNHHQHHHHHRNSSQTMTPTETLLLKTLRERQLVNLMRLEMLMAERQQSSSNRSNSWASRPSPSSASSASASSITTSQSVLGEKEVEPSRSSGGGNANKYLPVHQQRLPSPPSSISSNGKNQSDEEVMHHFMVMNPGTPLKLRQKWVEQQVEQQDHLEANNNQNDSPPNRTTLSRFKEWRDASARPDSTPSSSASMFRNIDRSANRANITLSPYDLSTGSSSKSIDSTNAIKKSAGDFDTVNDKNVGERLNRDYSDYSITRTGGNSFGRALPLGKSIFMTRSSVAHDESTTNPPPAKHEEGEVQPNQDERVASEESAPNDQGKMIVADEKEAEGKENAKDISDDEIEAQLMATEKPKTPIDYFSSYKNEYSSDLNVRRRWPTKKAGELGKKTKTTNEMGGMWRA